MKVSPNHLLFIGVCMRCCQYHDTGRVKREGMYYVFYLLPLCDECQGKGLEKRPFYGGAEYDE